MHTKYYIIYKITCNNQNITEGYVGTTKDFHTRKSKHKSRCKTSQIKLYKIIRENGGFENFTIVEIEKIKCNNRLESLVREQEWCNLIDSSLNSNKPMVNNKEEASKKYYEKNKEKKKMYRNINAIKLYQKKYKKEDQENMKSYKKYIIVYIKKKIKKA